MVILSNSFFYFYLLVISKLSLSRPHRCCWHNCYYWLWFYPFKQV